MVSFPINFVADNAQSEDHCKLSGRVIIHQSTIEITKQPQICSLLVVFSSKSLK